mmetsp:Transcript_14196/g.42315  ORF Transcript_14196/g.42315 Transcript_14196/m.42315 type:complete len:287 (-) Transcript_14196:81-941(-)
MASAAAAEGRRVGLHPLAIVGISDHFTRVKMGGSRAPADSPVFGLLFGAQKDLDLRVVDAIELARTAEGGLDHDFLAKQVELYTDVYEDRELVGWYALAAEADAGHLRLHGEFLRYNEAPVLLLMDPRPDPDAKGLPLTCLEHEVRVVDGAPRTLFAAVPFQLETLQAETIAMEHVARQGPGDGEAALDAHADAVDASLKTLGARVRALSARLRAGGAPDLALLRKLGALADAVSLESGALERAALRDYNDALVVGYLAAATQNAAAVHDLADKFMLSNARGSKLV